MPQEYDTVNKQNTMEENDPKDEQTVEDPESFEREGLTCLGTSMARTPEAISNNRNLWRMLQVQILSDFSLFIGGSFFLAFTIREIVSLCERDVTADVLYGFAAGAFFVSGSLALVIDVLLSRTISIGRYTTHKRWNIVITILFVTGVIIDIVAFVFWRKGEEGVPTERVLQWVSSHLWLLAAVISLVVIFVESGWSGAVESFEARFDLLGNVFFLGEAITNCLARYLTDINSEALNFTEMGLEISAAIFWTLNAVSFLIANCRRLHKFHPEICKQQQNV